MPSKQKAKGSSWERDAAKFLSNLYGESFIRAPGSGAYVGGTNTSRKDYLHEGQIRSFKGDIVPGQSFPHMNVECKNYADLAFHLLFTGEVKQLDTWIDQLMETADPGDFNILMIKITRKATLAVTQAHLFPPLMAQHQVAYSSKNHGSWIIMDFDKFWALNKDQVKELCK